MCFPPKKSQTSNFISNQFLKLCRELLTIDISQKSTHHYHIKQHTSVWVSIVYILTQPKPETLTFFSKGMATTVLLSWNPQCYRVRLTWSVP